ncbi:MAG: RNase adaptor protein RapZ [Sphingomonadales bacterium 17-56-6]|nr:MAG: RNase adaptor protein RapZ [Sphingomonadales bacterium 28-55-16]OYZ85793.1 MAG: RNase adaptor protein RapZ [Sphingomonadales bacterium 17-56-6]
MKQKKPSAPQKILLVTGLSGAGKTTVLKTLEDLGWETVDNFPIKLAGQLLKIPASGGEDSPNIPLALGFDSRTRGFDAEALIQQISTLQTQPNLEILTLFLDCAGVEIERRYAETRRRHPMAQDRPAMDGIAIDRNLMEPFRRWAETVVDTSKLSAHDLQQAIRERFTSETTPHATITVSSFGFSRGVPHNADLVFDLRFLRNPHWDSDLRPMTGMDVPVAEYVAADPKYDEAMQKIRDLLRFLLPLYDAQGKAYINIAFGCTGGRHRSVHVAELFGNWLREDGFTLTVSHRNLTSRPIDALEEPANGANRIAARRDSNRT